jgi:hypothetical protein
MAIEVYNQKNEVPSAMALHFQEKHKGEQQRLIESEGQAGCPCGKFTVDLGQNQSISFPKINNSEINYSRFNSAIKYSASQKNSRYSMRESYSLR